MDDIGVLQSIEAGIYEPQKTPRQAKPIDESLRQLSQRLNAIERRVDQLSFMIGNEDDTDAGETRESAEETFIKSVNDFANDVHNNSFEKGFWGLGEEDKDEQRMTSFDTFKNLHDKNITVGATVIASKLALIHSEVSEALESVRDRTAAVECAKLGDGVTNLSAELADIVIRVMDLAAAFDLDLGRAITVKHAYNKTRPAMHGGKVL